MTIAFLTELLTEGVKRLNNEERELMIGTILTILFDHFPGEFLFANKMVLELIEKGEI